MRPITETNLISAFAGESQAHMRYLHFSEIAEKESLPNMARLFLAVSHAEKIHAGHHFKNLPHLKGGFTTISMAGFGPGNTAKNLDIAIEGEDFEVDEMYPSYLETAEFQGEKAAGISFDWAYQTEKIHLSMYRKAKEAVEAGKDVDMGPIAICETCGYTVEGEAPGECPICKAKKDKFTTFS